MNPIFAKIVGAIGGQAGTQISSIVDGLTTTDGEKSSAKAQLTEIVLSSLNRITEAQADVLKTELSGNWLQRSWRPILMLTFAALLVVRWTGISDHVIPVELELELMGIIKLGLGGYVIGRSAEKISESVVKNIDMPFLKKKDRS